jgi:hypothetical protein
MTMCSPSELQKNLDNNVNVQARDSRSSCLGQGLWLGKDIWITRIEIAREGEAEPKDQGKGFATATPELKCNVSKLWAKYGSFREQQCIIPCPVKPNVGGEVNNFEARKEMQHTPKNNYMFTEWPTKDYMGCGKIWCHLRETWNDYPPDIHWELYENILLLR